jgi:hypothetical protein
MTPLADDPRFRTMLALLDAGHYYEASDLCEELFFEAVLDEVAFVRVFLQLAVGLHHVELLQWRPAVERLEEGIVAVDAVTNARDFDLVALRANLIELVRLIRLRSAATSVAALRLVKALTSSAHSEGAHDPEGRERSEEGQ